MYYVLCIMYIFKCYYRFFRMIYKFEISRSFWDYNGYFWLRKILDKTMNFLVSQFTLGMPCMTYCLQYCGSCLHSFSHLKKKKN